MRDKKIEHLKKLADDNGFFKIAAIDHRQVFINACTEITNKEISFSQIVNLKMSLIESLKPYVSSFLLDPIYSAKQVRKRVDLENKGLLVGIEGDDYSSTSFGDNYLTEEIDIDNILSINGDCVKLFIYYYDIDRIEILEKERALVKSVALKCHSLGLPFLFEPILAPEYSILSHDERIEAQKRMITTFSDLPIDIYKISFPCDLNEVSSLKAKEVCQSIISLSDAPFILLTSGINFETFKDQLKIFSEAGGCGYAMGRSLWSNGLKSLLEDGVNSEEMVFNIKEINDIIETYAKPWN
ncbi:MAG: hypothetical protein ACPKM0_02630 [Pleomorphochaeta sp.]